MYIYIHIHTHIYICFLHSAGEEEHGTVLAPAQDDAMLLSGGIETATAMAQVIISPRKNEIHTQLRRYKNELNTLPLTSIKLSYFISLSNFNKICSCCSQSY